MNRSIIFCFRSFLMTGLFALPAFGMVDQSQTVSTTSFSPIDATNIGGQSFIPWASNISGGRVFITANQSSPITFELYSSIGVGATPIASAVSATGYTGPAWAEATFSTPVPVMTPGDTYYLVFSGTSLGSPAAFFGGVTTDTYPDGNAYVNPNFTNPSVFPNFDFAFETLTVPEPSGAWMSLVFSSC